MNKDNFFWLLNNIVPGEKTSDSRIDPPNTNIYFSQIKEDFLHDFNKYSLNPKLYEHFEFKPFEGMHDTLAYYEKMIERMHKAKTHYYWFVFSKENNNLIGTANLASINFERSSVEWGQGIDPDYWGLNYNLEICEILKHYIFDVLSIHRLFGQTMIKNKRAIECMKASGCVFEGILRDFYNKDGCFIDAWLYSLLSEEYYEMVSKKINKKFKISIEEIISLISNIISEENINELSSMGNTLNWDSLSHTSIICSISDKYNIKFTPKDFTQLTSVKLITDFLNK